MILKELTQGKKGTPGGKKGQTPKSSTPNDMANTPKHTPKGVTKKKDTPKGGNPKIVTPKVATPKIATPKAGSKGSTPGKAKQAGKGQQKKVI